MANKSTVTSRETAEGRTEKAVHFRARRHCGRLECGPVGVQCSILSRPRPGSPLTSWPQGPTSAHFWSLNVSLVWTCPMVAIPVPHIR